MKRTVGSSAAVGGLVLFLCLASAAAAQNTTAPGPGLKLAPQAQPVTHLASVSSGAILGNVRELWHCGVLCEVGVGGRKRAVGE